MCLKHIYISFSVKTFKLEKNHIFGHLLYVATLVHVATYAWFWSDGLHINFASVHSRFFNGLIMISKLSLHILYRQVIEGTSTLKEIEQLETMNERPLTTAVIASCGTCTYEF